MPEAATVIPMSSVFPLVTDAAAAAAAANVNTIFADRENSKAGMVDYKNVNVTILGMKCRRVKARICSFDAMIIML